MRPLKIYLWMGLCCVLCGCGVVGAAVETTADIAVGVVSTAASVAVDVVTAVV